MSRIIKDRIDKDLQNNIIADWHDESHLNRYLIDFPPSAILGTEYCYDDKRGKGSPKIIAVRKAKEWNAKK